MKKTRIDLVKSWLKKAERDFKVAQRELSSDEPFSDIVCFHAQQAVEKYLKAYLTGLDIYFEKTHNIEDLVLLIAQKDETILDLKDIGTELTPYAIETRYPEFEEPALDDATDAVEIAEKFRDFIINRLSKGIEGERK